MIVSVRSLFNVNITIIYNLPIHFPKSDQFDFKKGLKSGTKRLQITKELFEEREKKYQKRKQENKEKGRNLNIEEKTRRFQIEEDKTHLAIKNKHKKMNLTNISNTLVKEHPMLIL